MCLRAEGPADLDHISQVVVSEAGARQPPDLSRWRQLVIDMPQ